MKVVAALLNEEHLAVLAQGASSSNHACNHAQLPPKARVRKRACHRHAAQSAGDQQFRLDGSLRDFVELIFEQVGPGLAYESPCGYSPSFIVDQGHHISEGDSAAAPRDPVAEADSAVGRELVLDGAVARLHQVVARY